MKSIFVSICSRNTAFWQMVTAFQIAANHVGQTLGMQCRLSPYVGDSLISRARCIQLRAFLDSGSDYLLTLDDDIELPADGITKLVQANKDLVGGLYRLKGDKPKVNPYAIRWKNENIHLKFDDIAEVQYLSTGCMLYKRDFVEDLVNAYPDLWFYENLSGTVISALYMPYIYKNEYLSEDWAFCQRALDQGHKIYVHGGVQCTHWGLHGFKVSDLTSEEKDLRGK